MRTINISCPKLQTNIASAHIASVEFALIAEVEVGVHYRYYKYYITFQHCLNSTAYILRKHL